MPPTRSVPLVAYLADRPRFYLYALGDLYISLSTREWLSMLYLAHRFGDKLPSFAFGGEISNSGSVLIVRNAETDLVYRRDPFDRFLGPLRSCYAAAITEEELRFI
jgi:hypothetical protein